MGFDLHFDKSGGSTVRRRVEGDRLRIGRGTNNDLRFDDARVGLQHATIARTGGGFVLQDRDSVTGTWVGRERVQRVRLADGDLIEIGGRRITVSLAPGDADLGLHVARSSDVGAALDTAGAAPTASGGRAGARSGRKTAAVRQVDYATVYRLGRGPLARRWLTLAAAATTLVTLGGLVASGRTTVFRPGPVSAAHVSAAGPTSCNACHVPFAGPVDARCAGCHAGHAVHQPTQAAMPACGGCHFEHRGLESLTVVSDARCVDCHGDLQLAPGAGATFASSVTGFGGGHPDFSVTLADGRRLPIAEAAGADPSTLKFGHSDHLKPLKTPEGAVQLACRDCHEGVSGEAAREGRMAPVSYERHCASCHPLTFDPALPAERAPHESPAVVRAYLLAAYAGDPGWRSMSFAERRRRIVTDPDRDRSFRLGEGERRAANRAEGYLFQTACRECHVLVQGAGALPEVAPVETSWDRLPNAWFPHARHGSSQGLACADCHDAAGSSRTSDLLIPGIAVCRSCHGGGGDAAGDALARGVDGATGDGSAAATDEGVLGLPRRSAIASACVDCHDFHAAEDSRPSRLASASGSDGGGR